jgi:drug/metabolite transporter (DMT)-like permease
MTNRRKGLLLVALSALLFSTPGLFTRAVEAGGWEVTFWRGLFGAFFTLLFLLWRRRGLRQEFAALGKPGLLAGVVWATGAIAYIMAFKLTSIANVARIVVGVHFRDAFCCDPLRSGPEAKCCIVEVNDAWPLLMWCHHVRSR